MKLLIVTQKVDSEDQLLGFFIDWLRLFASKFELVTILCLEAGNYDLPSNVRIISLGKDQKRPKIFWLFNFYKYIFSESKNYNAVLVHMNPIWMALGGICWQILNKKRYLWYTHKQVTAKLKMAEKFANKIFTASPESFRLKSDKVIVTGHGIDTELFKPGSKSKDGTLKLLSVGRIALIKNYETLVEACNILKNKNINFKVTIIGEPALIKDQEYELKIKNKINALGLDDSFVFIGKINHKDLPKYYQTNDIFIHLSKTGSLDKTMLEAMASGINVLSSNDSAKSILPEELIFRDDFQDLADKIIKHMGLGANTLLRNYVIENHNLAGLIGKISKIIQE